MTSGGNVRTAKSGRSMIALLMGSVALVSLAAPAQAQSGGSTTASRGQTRTFDIPSQPLSTALTVFGDQTGIQITGDTCILDGKRSQAVKGSYAPAQALSVLLGGTGITFRWLDGRSVSIERAPQVSEGTVQLGPVRVEGSGDGSGGSGGAGGPQVTANDRTASEGTGSYTKRDVAFAKGQSLQDIPQSVTVLTQQRMQDQGLTTIEEAMKQVTGITALQEEATRTHFFSRGFRIDNFQIDGNSPIIGGWNTEQIDLALYDSIEVLRGSDALFGTSGEPGGSINLVRKKPTRDFQFKAALSAGSWNNYRGEIDISGPLALDGRLRARIGGVIEDREYFYDRAIGNKQLVHGIVEFDVTDSTRLTVGGSYSHDRSPVFSIGLPRYTNGDDIGLPRSFYLGTKNDRNIRDRYNMFGRIDQTLGDDWTLGLEVSQNRSDNDRQHMFWYGAIDPITKSGMASGWGGAKYTYVEKIQAADLVLKGSFDLLGGTHKLLFGTNISNADAQYINRRRNNPISIPDIFTFDPTIYDNNDPYYFFGTTDLEIKQKGIYGSLNMTFGRFSLIPSMRLSWYRYRQYREVFSVPAGIMTSNPTIAYRDNGVLTPSIGAIYKFDDNWSAYASFAETYKSQASSLKGPLPGTAIDPITGKTFEVGVKGALLDGRLNTSAALYYIKRNGQAVRDSDYPATAGDLGSSCCFLADGRVVSKGVDLEISGEILPGWQMSGGYTFNDNENKQAGTGRYHTITPRHLFKFWTSYALRGALDGLKFGGGLTAQSSNYSRGTARTFNTTTSQYDGPSVPFEFTQKGYAVVNLFGEYNFNKNWSASFNVNNVFDKTYYQAVGSSSYYNFYGEPRNFLLTIRVSY